MVKFPGEVISSSAATTVIIGALVFVDGQLIIKGAVEPYIELKGQLGKISDLLLANQAKLANPCTAEMSEIIHKLRDAVAQLMSKHSTLPFHIKGLHIGFRFVPSIPEIISSAQKLNLIALIYKGKSKESTHEHIVEIGCMLKIPTTYSLQSSRRSDYIIHAPPGHSGKKVQLVGLGFLASRFCWRPQPKKTALHLMLIFYLQRLISSSSLTSLAPLRGGDRATHR